MYTLATTALQRTKPFHFYSVSNNLLILKFAYIDSLRIHSISRKLVLEPNRIYDNSIYYFDCQDYFNFT